MAQNNPLQPEAVENSLSSFEQFVNRYGKPVLWCVAAALLVVAGFLAYNRWVAAPARENARSAMFAAERAFAAGEFQTALNGDGNNPGFVQVIEEFGGKADPSVYYYAGVSALQLDLNQDAIDYLRKYKCTDPVMRGRAFCCIGDAYVNLENYGEALGWYTKAAAAGENAFRAAYLKKAALVQEKLGKEAEALRLYREIEAKYPQTTEGIEAVRFISRIVNR